MTTLSIRVPLADHERKLIDEFVSAFGHRVSRDRGQDTLPPLTSAFSHWYWTSRCRETFEEVGGDEAWINYHCGSATKYWECVERTLPTVTTTSHHFRFDDLESANAHLLKQKFAEQTQYHMIPLESDASYWETISKLVQLYRTCDPAFTEVKYDPDSEEQQDSDFGGGFLGLLRSALGVDPVDEHGERPAPGSVEFPEEILERHRAANWKFEIWSLVRACAAILRRQEGYVEFVRAALEKTGFYDLHDKVKNGYVRNKTKRLSEGDAEGEDSKRGWALTSKGLRLSTFGDDPAKILEYIPWKELEYAEFDDAENQDGKSVQMLWRPTISMPWEKHLYTEDDVFRACIENNISFPGVFLGNEVGFIASPISDFEIETQFRGGYWGHWNDCAVTYKSDTDEYFVLETLPGRKFRELYSNTNQMAALKYFRALIEHQTENRTESLQELLGLHFQPEFENLLHLIPLDQFPVIDELPLGEGQRGVVHRAVWRRPRVIGTRRAEDVQVALKSIKVDGEMEIKRFMKELDATFGAVSGRGIRIVELLGITKTPPRNERTSWQFLRPETFFLVLEFAGHGTVVSYLENALDGTRSDWWKLVRFMGDISTGVDEIHQRKIVHRDLHWGNLLVASRLIQKEPGPVLNEHTALIADLGESQLISTQPHGRTYYGHEAFWAPEVRRRHTHSPASDVYAMGRLFLWMVDCHWQLVPADSQGERHFDVPQVILEVIIACMLEDSSLRPSSADVQGIIEDIGVPIDVSDEEWADTLEYINVDVHRLMDCFQQASAESTADDIVT